jgi:hypothetical protein
LSENQPLSDDRPPTFILLNRHNPHYMKIGCGTEVIGTNEVVERAIKVLNCKVVVD